MVGKSCLNSVFLIWKLCSIWWENDEGSGVFCDPTNKPNIGLITHTSGVRTFSAEWSEPTGWVSLASSLSYSSLPELVIVNSIVKRESWCSTSSSFLNDVENRMCVDTEIWNTIWKWEMIWKTAAVREKKRTLRTICATTWQRIDLFQCLNDQKIDQFTIRLLGDWRKYVDQTFSTRHFFCFKLEASEE